jgi:CRP-like cAMP-binding protein
MINQIKKIILLSEEETWEIKTRITIKKIENNEMLYNEGSFLDSVFYVSDGIFRNYYTVDGNEKIIRFYKKGEWIWGLKKVLPNYVSRTTIQALENCVVYSISKFDLKQLSTRILNWSLLETHFYKKLIIEKQEYLEFILTKKTEERYFEFIKNNKDLVNNISQYYIAQYIGIQPETLSRIKNRKLTFVP